MKLQPERSIRTACPTPSYDMLFTKDKPIIFAFHGYPTLVHELTYRRHNRNLHVRGYREEGTITTPFDMRVQNDIDRFHLVKDVLLRLPQLGNRGAYLYQKMSDKLVQHQQYINEYGEDMPEVREWKWNNGELKWRMTVKDGSPQGAHCAPFFFCTNAKNVRKVFGWQEYNCRVPWGTTSAHPTVRLSITLITNF